jgi:hypothetical protein
MRDLPRPASVHRAGQQLACALGDRRRLLPGRSFSDPYVPYCAPGGLWTHQKGGFYHDGRFAMLIDVVDHYDKHFDLGLSNAQKSDLVEYLKGL